MTLVVFFAIFYSWARLVMGGLSIVSGLIAATDKSKYPTVNATDAVTNGIWWVATAALVLSALGAL